MSAKSGSLLPPKPANEAGAKRKSPKPRRGSAPVVTPRRPTRARRGNVWALLLMTLAGVVAAVLAMPSFIVLACGMPPALAAALIDDRPGGHASSCIFAASLTGVAPVLASLWAGGNTVVAAMQLMSDVYVWLGMYGAAAVGWMLIWLWPIIAEIVLAVVANQRIQSVRAFQERLVKEWSETVAGAT